MNTAGKPSRWKKFNSQLDLQSMVWPGIIFVFIFSYIPMYGVVMAFQQYDIFGGMINSPWVGWMQFRMFFEAPEFWNVMRNTLVISLLKLIISFPAPILLALMLNEVGHMGFKRVIQTVSYLPYFLSWVIVSGFVFSLLSVDNGTVNYLLERFNLVQEPVNFLAVPKYFWSILVSVNVWKEVGFGSIVYLAAIAGIDPTLYEAASIDGASRFKQIHLITLPSITPIIVIFMILAIGGLLSAGFEDILLLATNPILRPYSDVIDTYVYRVGILNARFSYATAVGLFKAVISVLLLVTANKIARRADVSLW
ncbi:binding-protein-dependent transport systems inner membrane component [Paenibacillus sp. FSL R7-277]|uniref:ABC transporter permease n=1 Tax=Paenibacillus sp. FSL R7-277 TaxID=1227352 RepID=UPI0003E23777|nr:ABC transporter permease subunit [Paenibacillus sp. FSL R7-277]ETT76116.1 binding-protein-dependent transport systems inner membrane component [Paenibacillus sp. FSL R7-277]